MGFDKNDAPQLDWILKQGTTKVLFYDSEQSVKSSDIPSSRFREIIETSQQTIAHYELQTQMRCMGGGTYIDYVKDILSARNPDFKPINNYDFKIFDDVDDMIQAIIARDGNLGLCRTVAGFSWEWATKNSGLSYEDMVVKDLFDIDICGHKYIWNMINEGWILSPDADRTIGCIHTSQGYDLNYVGVIFGNEIDYDPNTHSIIVDINEYYDKKVKAATPEEEIRTYIINAYSTMMARGIKGCYIYACKENLRNYLKNFIPPNEPQ